MSAGTHARARATGIGSWPGTHVREAVGIVRDLLAGEHLPYLPELPARGPGADVVGRTATAVLVELPVDLQPSGWRLVDRPGRDMARGQALLREDLDELAEAYDGLNGPLKVQVCGPITLGAALRLHRGERVLTDQGALRESADSLAEGVGALVGRLRRLVPGAEVLVQLDEPGLPAVLAGTLPTSSGFGRLPALDPAVTGSLLMRVLAAHDGPTAIHCCAPRVPLPVLRRAAPSAIAVDTGLLEPRGWEGLAVAAEDGVEVWAGAVPTTAPVRAAEVAASLAAAWQGLGMPRGGLARLVVTPSCGLAGLAPDEAVAAQRRAIEAAAELTELAHS